MKKFLVLISIVLSVATTGLYAAGPGGTPTTTTESVLGQDEPGTTGKRHKHKKHHKKKGDQAAPTPTAPAQ